ncbi:MAG: hypothetical protein LBD53_02555 [Tannerella sp.]|jgi:hypothetical protein|nr:hypothetical protein [Tannerella sp.]
MNSSNYLPHAYNALLNWLTNFEQYAVENAARLGLPSSELEALNPKIDNFRIANEKAEHPNAGKADRLDRKEKAELVSKYVRDFVNRLLRYNQAVTNEDRVKLGLNVPDTTPTPIQPPTTWPVASTSIAGPRQIRVDWHDSLSASKAKPKGVHGCEIRHSILDTPPTTNDDLLRSDFATRNYHTFNFDESQRGKSVYFCLRWETNKGDKGPWSEFIKAIIP